MGFTFWTKSHCVIFCCISSFLNDFLTQKMMKNGTQDSIIRLLAFFKRRNTSKIEINDLDKNSFRVNLTVMRQNINKEVFQSLDIYRQIACFVSKIIILF